MNPIGAFLLVVATVGLGVAAEVPAAAELPATPSPVKVERLGLNFAPIGLADESAAPPPVPENSNAIVLPKFEVRDDPLRLSKRDVTSAKELLAQAKRRYLTQTYQATFGQLSAAIGKLLNVQTLFEGWHPNDAEAALLFAQDERLRRKREFEDLVDLVELVDPAASQELRRTVTDGFRHQVPLGTRRRE